MLVGGRQWPFALVPLGVRHSCVAAAEGDADGWAAILYPAVMEGYLLLCLSPVPGHGPAAAPTDPREKPLWLELGRVHSIHQMVPFLGSRNYLQGKVKSSTGL